MSDAEKPFDYKAISKDAIAVFSIAMMTTKLPTPIAADIGGQFAQLVGTVVGALQGMEAAGSVVTFELYVRTFLLQAAQRIASLETMQKGTNVKIDDAVNRIEALEKSPLAGEVAKLRGEIAQLSRDLTAARAGMKAQLDS